MQAPGDNAISIVEPQTTYADNNLNEKTLSTQYIYTTEGQLIPATQEVVSANMDLNPQHFGTAQVGEAQGIHIQQVEYQYEQQYPDGTIQQVPSGEEQFVENQSYVVTDSTYITEQQSIQNTIDQGSTETDESYGFAATQVQDTFVSTQPVQTTASYVENFDANSEDSQQESVQTPIQDIKEESRQADINEEYKGEEPEKSEQKHIQKCTEEPAQSLNESIQESVQDVDVSIQSADKLAYEATEKAIEETDVIRTDASDVICTDASDVICTDESDVICKEESDVVCTEESVQDTTQLQVDSNIQPPVEITESSPKCQETCLNIEGVNLDKAIDMLPNTTKQTKEMSIAETELEQSVENIIEHITDPTRDEDIIETATDKENDQAESVQTENIVEESQKVIELEQITPVEESPETHSEIETLTEHSQLTADIIDGQNQVEITVEDIQGDDDASQDDNESCDVQEETMVIVYEDSSSQEALSEDETYNVNIIESTKKSRSDTPKPRPRGRRPKKEIPLHILGHDVNKPVDDATNGKAPKPRLGVKVPYRNLTSQMVSRQEIENEIMERGKKRQQNKDVMFVRSLTARLAKKLSPSTVTLSKQTKSETVTDDLSSSNQNIKDTSKEDSNSNATHTDEKSSTETKDGIDNNSDLLAILEGNDESEEIVLPKESTSQKKSENTKSGTTPTDETSLKNLEREIALQQLQDLPYLSPTNRFVRGKICKSFLKEIPNLSYSADGKASITPSAKLPSRQTKETEADLKASKSLKQVSEKKTHDVEPQIKVNIALKTYSRKRKSMDNPPEPLPAKKSPVPLSTAHIDLKSNASSGSPTDGVYITKSSRIIKKKVIWDPAEPQVRAVVTKQISHKNDDPVSPKASTKPPVQKSETKVVERTEKKPESKIETEKKNKEMDERSSPKKTVQPTGASDKKISPTVNKLVQKPKKVRSEVDKLLGDEGTIKMLYELKNDPVEEKRRKTTISVEKTFKDLAKKANQIKSDLVNNSSVESPKSLRKKEQVGSPVTTTKQSAPSPTLKAPSPVPSTVSRQKSKDSNRSTPPRSPQYNFPNETSYLIRRRSSSSISSAGEGEGSIEMDDEQERVLRRKTRSSPLTDVSKSKRHKKISEPIELEGELDNKSQKKTENRIGHYNTFTLKKVNKNVTIDLHTADSTGGYFTLELLEELTTALNKISKEKDCQLVLIRSSQEKIFSLGLDYKSLICEKEVDRKTKATELAEHVSNFVKRLLHFPKILVAGIEGQCVGLAATILPLFDIVIASDTASFSAPYSSLATIAECAFLLSPPYMPSHGLSSELFYIGQTLTADEVYRKGLISKVCWPEKYQETVKSMVAAISKGSKASLETMKKQITSSILESTETLIQSTTKQVVEFWISPECQKNFIKME